jgi:hypothetical protein
MSPLDAAVRALTLALVVGLAPSAVELVLGYILDERRAPTAAGRAAKLAALPGLLAFGAGVGLLLPAPPLAYGPTAPAALGAALALAALVLGVTRPWRALREGARPDAPGLPIALGAALGLLPAGLLGAAVLLTGVGPDVATLGAATRAQRRAQIVPYDAEALLALAYDASRRERGERAEKLRGEAARAGAAPVPLLELEAELAAQRGDCETAREAFDRALAARTADAMDDVLERPLALDAFTLPPTLVRLCGVGGPAGTLSAP